MTDHKAAWLQRYGADYATTEEQDSAYADHQAALAEMHLVFARGDDDKWRPANATVRHDVDGTTITAWVDQ